MTVQKLKDIMAEIFEVPADSIDDDASPDTLEVWDSLGHLKLISAIEEAFSMKFAMAEVMEADSLPALVSIVEAATENAQ